MVPNTVRARLSLRTCAHPVRSLAVLCIMGLASACSATPSDCTDCGTDCTVTGTWSYDESTPFTSGESVTIEACEGCDEEYDAFSIAYTLWSYHTKFQSIDGTCSCLQCYTPGEQTQYAVVGEGTVPEGQSWTWVNEFKYTIEDGKTQTCTVSGQRKNCALENQYANFLRVKKTVQWCA